MATNENGNLLDDAGNVAVDFVWGNLPLAPNDERAENGGGLLDPALDNHEIAYQGWNGYPGYTPNTAGAEGAGYVVVPSVLGLATAAASRILTDDGFTVTPPVSEEVFAALAAIAQSENSDPKPSSKKKATTKAD